MNKKWLSEPKTLIPSTIKRLPLIRKRTSQVDAISSNDQLENFAVDNKNPKDSSSTPSPLVQPFTPQVEKEGVDETSDFLDHSTPFMVNENDILPPISSPIRVIDDTMEAPQEIILPSLPVDESPEITDVVTPLLPPIVEAVHESPLIMIQPANPLVTNESVKIVKIKLKGRKSMLSRDLGTSTVQRLREMCKEKGLSTAGKKKELIDRLSENTS